MSVVIFWVCLCTDIHGDIEADDDNSSDCDDGENDCNMNGTTVDPKPAPVAEFGK